MSIPLYVYALANQCSFFGHGRYSIFYRGPKYLRNLGLHFAKYVNWTGFWKHRKITSSMAQKQLGKSSGANFEDCPDKVIKPSWDTREAFLVLEDPEEERSIWKILMCQ